MSVPPELLKAVQAGGGGAKPPGMGAPPPGGPPGGPMVAPQEQAGVKQQAMIDVSIGVKVLTKALAAFGPLSKEGKALNGAIGTLIREFGAEAQKSEDLIPAEIQQLARQVPGAGGGSPIAKTMAATPPIAPPAPQPGA